MAERAYVDPALVSARLKALRARLALYQHEVAGALGVSRRTFQSWENGEKITAIENYQMLADYYSEQLGEEITVRQLLDGPQGWADHELSRMAEALRMEMDEKLAALREEIVSELAPRIAA